MTTFQRILDLVCLAVGILLAVVLAAKIGQKRGYSSGYRDALSGIKPDTVYRDTTIYKDNPVPVEVKPAGQEFYPVGTVAQLKHVIDSLAAQEPDTTYIYYPIQLETQLFRDDVDSTYEAQITGWHVSLDWIKVNQRTAYITVPVPEYKYPRFMLSPSVDAQIIPRAFFASANLDLDFWKGCWQFSAQGGYGAGFVDGQFVHGPTATVVAKYNLIRK